MKKGFAYTAVAALVVSYLVIFIPSAAAQQEKPLAVVPDDGKTNPESVSTNPESVKKFGRLKPEVEVAQFKYYFKVEIPIASGCVIPITMTYEAKALGTAAAWSNLVLTVASETQTYSNQQGVPLTGTKDYLTGFSTMLTVSLKREAPAFDDGTYVVTAKAKVSGQTSSGCNFKESEPLPTQLFLKNDYIARMVYEPSTYIIKTGQNKKVTFVITMTNLGNGPTKVTTSANQDGEKNKLDSVISPLDKIVLSKAQNINAKNFEESIITVQTPHSNGYQNRFYNVNVKWHAIYDNTAVSETTFADDGPIRLSVQVQGVYVPGFDPTGAIAALGLGLLLLGLARRGR